MEVESPSMRWREQACSLPRPSSSLVGPVRAVVEILGSRPRGIALGLLPCASSPVILQRVDDRSSPGWAGRPGLFRRSMLEGLSGSWRGCGATRVLLACSGCAEPWRANTVNLSSAPDGHAVTIQFLAITAPAQVVHWCRLLCAPPLSRPASLPAPAASMAIRPLRRRAWFSRRDPDPARGADRPLRHSSCPVAARGPGSDGGDQRGWSAGPRTRFQRVMVLAQVVPALASMGSAVAWIIRDMPAGWRRTLDQ